MIRQRHVLLLLPALLAAIPCIATADEGMWLFNHFPSQTVEKKYGFQVTGEFLNHLQRSAVRFNNGGTGSFVSNRGLLFTNHHVGSDCIQKVSSASNDYMKNGFYAATAGEEKRCPDLEVNVLESIENVTARVNSGIDDKLAPAEANQKRKAAMSAIEKECATATGLRCDVVTLFHGGQYHLYRYKKYTDVRLVFAPESDIAFFGGDAENFTYPRYNLDVAFFRAYENGAPAQVAQWFRWSGEGVKNGELIFVPGNPGTTGRLMTMAELEFARDVSYPLILRRLSSLIAATEKYMASGSEEKRVGSENLQGQQNSFKAYTGFLRGLRDKSLMDKKQFDEKNLRAAIAKDAVQKEKFGPLWDELQTAYAKLRTFYPRYWLFETGATRGSELMAIARDVVRYAEETQKPNDKRLREYAETALPAREQALFSTAPITPSMETVVLANYFEFLVKELGRSDATVKAILNGKSPRQAARAYISGTRLIDVETRKRLAKDPAAMRASDDPMIRLALTLDGPARELRKRYEDEVESIVTRAASQIAQARFALSGGNEYPDATFTMRLTYGDVKGYPNDQGQLVPWTTTIGGLYPKGTGKEPYVIPASWLKANDKFDLNTPFNFVSTADTHGGNSGSATLNTKGEVVGILFDGNIESLPNRFVYTDEQSRSVHVASQAVIEALRKAYSATRVLDELAVKP